MCIIKLPKFVKNESKFVFYSIYIHGHMDLHQIKVVENAQLDSDYVLFFSSSENITTIEQF